jgi:hypothetical protein
MLQPRRRHATLPELKTTFRVFLKWVASLRLNSNKRCAEVRYFYVVLSGVIGYQQARTISLFVNSHPGLQRRIPTAAHFTSSGKICGSSGI